MKNQKSIERVEAPKRHNNLTVITLRALFFSSVVNGTDGDR